MKIKRNIAFKLFAYGKAKDKFQIRLRVTFNGQRLDLSAGTSPDIVRKWTGHKKKKTMRPYRAAQNIILNNPSSPHKTSPFQLNCGRTTHIGNGAWGLMTPEHIFAQKQFEQKFVNCKTFWVAYYARIDGKLKKVKVNLREYYDQCIIESPLGKRRADILLKSSTHIAPPIMIEVWFSHRCEQEKIDEGTLIIEFRIRDYRDIFQRVKSWGLIEGFLNNRNPDVRFHNFRERYRELPWK